MQEEVWRLWTAINLNVDSGTDPGVRSKRFPVIRTITADDLRMPAGADYRLTDRDFGNAERLADSHCEKCTGCGRKFRNRCLRSGHSRRGARILLNQMANGPGFMTPAMTQATKDSAILDPGIHSARPEFVPCWMARKAGYGITKQAPGAGSKSTG
jgi:hypothetical protein